MRFVDKPDWLVIEPSGEDHPGEVWVQWYEGSSDKFTRLRIGPDLKIKESHR